MNIKKKLGTAGLVTVVATLVALTAPTAAFADTSVPPTKGTGATNSTDDVYLYDAELNRAGATIQWDDTIAGSPSASDALAGFTVPTNVTDIYVFLSQRGQEAVKANWRAYAEPYTPPVPGSVLLPPLSPATLITPGENYAAGAPGVKTAGGEYSIGFAAYNGVTLIGKSFVYIDVTAGTGAFTYSTPAAAAVAPVITTTALNAATVGSAFTQTIAATGTAPITWAVQSGSLPTGLALNASTGAITGTPTAGAAYSFTLRATNSAGFDDQAFTGSVNGVVPTQPTGTDAGKQTIAAPAAGATTVTIQAPAANTAYQVWAWSDPTNLGQVTSGATGSVVVPIASLLGGQHTVALTLPGDATLTVVAWGTFEKLSTAGDPLTDSVDVQATVTASDLWSLNAENTKVDFGNVTRGATKTASLGKVTVVDDRNLLKGWDLNAGWTKFTKGTDEIPASALTVAGKLFAGYTPVSGIEAGTGTNLAKSTAVSTSPAGALFDADLTFTAPVTAQAGEYHSTLTLTLTSR